MKKNLLLFVSAVTFIACNNKPPQECDECHCDEYPYCSEYSIHPTNWLCGRLKAEPSPFDEKDTVVAMTVQYVYQSNMNGLTYFITPHDSLISLLNDDGTRKETIEIEVKYDYTLYPYKGARDLPPQYVHCIENEEYEKFLSEMYPEDMDYQMRCLDLNDHVLLFNYYLELQNGQTYDRVTEKGDTIRCFKLYIDSYFKDVDWPTGA